MLLPILIYANIFGFKTANYVSFLTLISSDFKKILSVDSLAFYVDIAPVWYRNVSPIFTNYLIINTVMVWIFFFINKCISNYESLEDEQGRMLQKTMNAKITSFKVNAYK